MKIVVRQWLDIGFTLVALASVVLVVAAVVGILLPMIWQGSGAVVFLGTVEFRRMQLEQFQRGDAAAIRAEMAQAAALRARVYEILDRFALGMAPLRAETRVRQLHRELVVQIENRDLPARQASKLKGLSRKIRDGLLDAMQSTDKRQAMATLDEVITLATDPRLRDTLGAEFLPLARQYREAIAKIDLGRRKEYAQALGEVQELASRLLGPRPGERLPVIVMEQYGATRWRDAVQLADRLFDAETWVAAGPGEPLRLVRVPRTKQFSGTELAELFPLVRENLDSMLHPRWTFYWQYFFDDNRSGHYFGGVGPEILGTLLVTVLAISMAMPIGVITAACLVEMAGDNLATRILRMAINTLAGVPSIVFGLFGLAFFVVFLLPKAGMPEGSSVLAGAMTLALLVLPVVIRASEEAIRNVPRAYQEAALALGASRFRTMMTVTLPAALPGILTGLILSMSRAAGETAPILFTAGVAMGPIPTSLARPTRTLAYSCYDMAVGDKMAALAPHNQFGMVMTLVGLVLVLNFAAILLRSRIARRLRGQ